MDSRQEKYDSFYVEAKSDYDSSRIAKFFEKKSIKTTNVTLESKANKICSYKVDYVYTPDALIGLEAIKKEKLYDKEDFKITKFEIKSDYKEIVEKKYEEVRTTKKITYPIEYEKNCHKHFVKQVGAIGLEFINQEILNKQRSVLTYMIKTLGTNILVGKSLMSVSLPIYLSDYRSQVENFAYNCRLHAMFLEKAAEASGLTRLKLVTTNFVSCLHLQLLMAKPFNPIIGETFQAVVGNSHCYSEQVSHHPPISRHFIDNPLFKMYGYIAGEANTSANEMTMTINGNLYIDFNDGAKFKYSFPKFHAAGLMVGNRYINYKESLTVEDLTNGLTSCINFNPDERSLFGKLFSKETFPDYFNGFIANSSDVKKNKKTGMYECDKKLILSRFEGEWTRFLNVDDVCFWNQEDEVLSDMLRPDFILPSDAHFRDDLILFKMGLNDQAQEAKTALEESQRHDAKLRKPK